MNKTLPFPIVRVVYHRRNGRDKYITWLAEKLGVQASITDDLQTRASIDDYMLNLISNEKPDWVEAAEAVVEEVVEEVAQTTNAVNPFSEIDYDSWTVVELRAECKSRGIPVYGTKAEIVLRMRRNDEGLDTQPTENETEAPSEEAAEEELDAPAEEVAVTEEVENNDSEQGTDINEEE